MGSAAQGALEHLAGSILQRFCTDRIGLQLHVLPGSHPAPDPESLSECSCPSVEGIFVSYPLGKTPGNTPLSIIIITLSIKAR